MARLVYDTLDGIGQSFALLDLFPDTHAWAKDRDGLFVCGNRLFCERFGFASMSDLVGKTDYDLAPADMAERYCSDDKRVLDGATVTDRLELIVGEGDSVEWFLTSKWPLQDRRENIIGTFGMSRHLNYSERRSIPYQELSTPIDYIQQHFSGAISVEELAGACSLSVSALERRFKRHLNKTPRQYITEVRLGHGRRLLVDTEKPIGTIALETGFADHSHFSRAFSKHFGHPPGTLRKSR